MHHAESSARTDEGPGVGDASANGTERSSDSSLTPVTHSRSHSVESRVSESWRATSELDEPELEATVAGR